jgi:mannose-6-phosphate isomerase-like protein (cupin superfamily)
MEHVMLEISLKSKEREKVFAEIELYLTSNQFKISGKDFTRPWGGFFVIDEQQASKFAAHFFAGVKLDSLKISGKLSPKILVVEPGKRLSWQYHHRRAEIWRCISGSANVITSATDEESESHTLQAGDEIRLAQGQRHRIVGLANWGVLAEIWQHTDVDNPSDESDIVRVQDDFGR